MEKVSSARIALKWGLIYGIITILYTTIAYNTELWKNQFLGIGIGVVLSVLFLYLAMNEFKILNGGFMTFSQGLGVGMLTSATSGLLSMVYDFLYKKFIDPNVVDQQLEMAREQYESMGMAEEQIEAAIEKAASYTDSGLAFIFGMLFVLFFGLIISLIVAGFVKKDKPVFS